MSEMGRDEARRTLEGLVEALPVLLAELADCRRDHPPEPWASELEAENERLKAKVAGLEAALDSADEHTKGLMTEVERLSRAVDSLLLLRTRLVEAREVRSNV